MVRKYCLIRVKKCRKQKRKKSNINAFNIMKVFPKSRGLVFCNFLGIAHKAKEKVGQKDWIAQKDEEMLNFGMLYKRMEHSYSLSVCDTKVRQKNCSPTKDTLLFFKAETRMKVKSDKSITEKESKTHPTRKQVLACNYLRRKKMRSQLQLQIVT